MTKSRSSAKRQSNPPAANEQHKRFIEAAREAECSEDEAVFDETLRRLANTKPEKPPEKKDK